VRKVMVMLLLAVLPFQFVWGAAAAYCQHEQGSEVTHFGHHFHKHQAKVGKTSAGTVDASKQPAGDDADCVACHMSCASVLSETKPSQRVDQAEQAVPSEGHAYSRLLVPSIDRPNWVAFS